VSIAALAGTPAQAAPSWLSPVRLSEGPGEAEAPPEVASDARGDYVAVWRRYNTGLASFAIEEATRPSGTAGWLPAEPVSVAGEDPEHPQVGLDAGGDAVVVWLDRTGESSIRASTRSGLSGTWSKPDEIGGLGKLGLVSEPRPDLAVNARGEAAAVWQRSGIPYNTLEAAVLAGGKWGSAEVVSHEAAAMHVAEVGIDAAGDTTAAWEQEAEVEKEKYLRATTASRPAGGKWGAPTFLSKNPGNAIEPHIAENGAGEAVVIWERPPTSEELVEASTRAGPTASWSAPAQLDREETGKIEPAPQQVGLDAHGDAVAVWSRLEGTHDIIEAVTGRVATNRWGASQTISAKGNLVEQEPQVAVDEGGDAVIVWPQWNGTEEIVEGVAGSAVTGTWGAAKPIAAAGERSEDANVAVDSHGDAAAVWLRANTETGGFPAAEAAGFDAGPHLEGLSIPSSGTTGQTLSFAVSPLDAWSALAATTWSFGDGAGAGSASVTHAYTAPGAYTVTLSAANVLGNVNTATTTVTISAPSACACAPPVGRLAPRITAASLTRSRFRVARAATAISARRAPPGTAFHFTLNEAAGLTIEIEHSVPGLRSGRHCLAPTASRRREHAKRCTRTVTVATLSRASEKQGADSVPFTGRIGHRPLALGPYTAVLSASSAGLTSAPVTLKFTVAH
jgi:PKD repeat protein